MRRWTMFEVIHLETGEVIEKFTERGEANYYITDCYGPEASQFTVRSNPSKIVTSVTIKEGELDKLLFLSFRYALGRSTYVTHVVSELLLKYKNYLTTFSKETIIKEIEDAIKNDRAGMKDFDVPVWERVVESL